MESFFLALTYSILALLALIVIIAAAGLLVAIGFLASIPVLIIIENIRLKYNISARSYEEWWRKKLQ